MEYNFCPKCGGETEQKAHNLLVCSNCGYNFYINPTPTNAVILEKGLTSRRSKASGNVEVHGVIVSWAERS